MGLGAMPFQGGAAGVVLANHPSCQMPRLPIISKYCVRLCEGAFAFAASNV